MPTSVKIKIVTLKSSHLRISRSVELFEASLRLSSFAVCDIFLLPQQVLAKESETKERFIGSTNVTVEVINANDNTPIFERLVYVFTAFENISTEKAVGHVKVCKSFIVCNLSSVF